MCCARWCIQDLLEELVIEGTDLFEPHRSPEEQLDDAVAEEDEREVAAEVHLRVCPCAHACACACVRACVCMHVCVRAVACIRVRPPRMRERACLG